jgi:hypothetical protein
MSTAEAEAIQKEVEDGFSEPNYGGSKYSNWSLKEDCTVLYRFFPSMKSLRRRKDYTQFWYTHFWDGVNPKNSAKNKAYPILCIQEKDFQKGGIITKRCPLCERREFYKNKAKAVEAKGAAAGASKAQIANASRPYNQWLKNHGHDGKYRLYAMNKAGELGVLRLNSKATKKLRDEIKALVQNGHRPISLEKGVWFEFTRTGTGFQVEDSVRVYRTEAMDGSGDSKIEFHTITPKIASEALQTLPDFDDEQKRISYPVEVLELLAAEGDDPAKVPGILGIKVEEEDHSPNFDPDAQTGVEDDGFAVSAKPVSQVHKALPTDADTTETGGSVPKMTSAPQAVTEDDEEAELAAALAAARAKKAARAATSAPKATKDVVVKVTPPATSKLVAAPPGFNPATATDADLDSLWADSPSV